MITANDLRIGNWVLVKGTYVLVESISDSGINIEAVGGYYAGEASTECEAYFHDWGSGNKFVEPIPLTPEVLEKCGFKEREPDSKMVISVISEHNIILNRYKSDQVYWFLYPALWHPTAHILYLHQLQTLYFALTGNELEINL